MQETPIRVLCIEDDEDEFLVMQRMLLLTPGKRFVLERESRTDAALSALRSPVHDAILLDYNLGETTGLDLLRAEPRRPGQAPVIVVTGAQDPEIPGKALELGASSFLDKNRLCPSLLQAAILNAIEQARIEARTMGLRASN